MDGSTLGLAIPLGLGMAAIGSGIGLGKAIEGGMNAMGRQPEAIGQIQTAMIIGCAFIEALTIYALIAVIMLMGKAGYPRGPDRMEMITPNVTQVLTTVVGFLLLVWVMAKFAWGPILDQLDKRRDKIERDYAAAEEQLGEAESLKADFAVKLGEIKTLERERIQEAVKKGEGIAGGIVAEARQQAEVAKAKGRQDLEIEAQKAQVELRDTVVALAIGAAEKLIHERLDDQKHRQLIEQYIDHIEGSRRA